jgi:hypothetical protein
MASEFEPYRAKNVARWNPDEGVLLHRDVGGMFVSIDAYNKLDRRIAELQAQLDGKWISAKEQMPAEEDREFWGYIKGTWGGADRFYMDKVKTWRNKSGEIRFNCGCLEEVTHWQPLPQPPNSAPTGEGDAK